MSNELKKYVLECFEFLELDYKELKDSVFEVKYNSGITKITFNKKFSNEALYLTNESSFVKNISKAVTLKKLPVPSAILEFKIDELKDKFINSFTKEHKFNFKNPKRIKQKNLIFWIKFSLKGFKNEEMIKLIKFNEESKKITLLNYSTEFLFEKIVDRNKNVRVQNRKEIENEIINNMNKISKKYIEEKNKEAKVLLENEISRINNYYDLLENEDSSGETSSIYASKNERKSSLEKERKNLIEQQQIKYQFTEDNLKIELLEVIQIDELIEEIDLVIKNKFITKQFHLKSDEEFIYEKLSKFENNLTLISDGSVVNGDDIAVCKQCKNSFKSTDIKYCSVCKDETCISCSNRSVISHAVLCDKHVETCTSCNDKVSVEEMEKCQSCGVVYCKWCLSGGNCSLCNDLY